MAQFAAAAQDRTAAANGIFTAKLHWYQFAWLTDAIGNELGLGHVASATDLAPIFPGLRFVYLGRRDRASQGDVLPRRDRVAGLVSARRRRAQRMTDDPDWRPDLQQVRFLEDALATH